MYIYLFIHSTYLDFGYYWLLQDMKHFRPTTSHTHNWIWKNVLICLDSQTGFSTIEEWLTGTTIYVYTSVYIYIFRPGKQEGISLAWAVLITMLRMGVGGMAQQKAYRASRIWTCHIRFNGPVLYRYDIFLLPLDVADQLVTSQIHTATTHSQSVSFTCIT